MKKFILILLLLSFPLIAVEYESVHEETYWDLSTSQVSGFYSGKVRSNVNGKIFYGEIQIEEDGKLSGEINHRDKNNKQEEFKDLKVS